MRVGAAYTLPVVRQSRTILPANSSNPEQSVQTSAKKAYVEHYQAVGTNSALPLSRQKAINLYRETASYPQVEEFNELIGISTRV